MPRCLTFVVRMHPSPFCGRASARLVQTCSLLDVQFCTSRCACAASSYTGCHTCQARAPPELDAMTSLACGRCYPISSYSRSKVHRWPLSNDV